MPDRVTFLLTRNYLFSLWNECLATNCEGRLECVMYISGVHHPYILLATKNHESDN